MDTVRPWMSSPAIVAAAATPLPQARVQIWEQHICWLPVVDNAGRLVGIVTEGDINGSPIRRPPTFATTTSTTVAAICRSEKL